MKPDTNCRVAATRQVNFRFLQCGLRCKNVVVEKLALRDSNQDLQPQLRILEFQSEGPQQGVAGSRILSPACQKVCFLQVQSQSFFRTETLFPGLQFFKDRKDYLRRVEANRGGSATCMFQRFRQLARPEVMTRNLRISL